MIVNRLISRSALVVACLATVLSGLYLVAAPPPASALVGVAALQIDQASEPTNLVPGSAPFGTEAAAANPKYKLTITNVGGATTNNVVVTDQLPARLSVATSIEPVWRIGHQVENAGSPVPCAVSGKTVTCTVEEHVGAGAKIYIYIPLEVESGLAATVENEVTVTAPEVATARGEVASRVTAEPPSYGFLPGPHGLSGSAFGERGEAPAAGSHPFSLDLTANLPVIGVGREGPFQELRPLDAPRSLGFELPTGIVVNPRATAERCPHIGLQVDGNGCPPTTQVGRIYFDVLAGIESGSEPLYNMQPEPGVPAELGFEIEGVGIYVRGGLSGGFKLTASSSEILTRFPIAGITAELWGNPSDPRHDYARESAHASCDERGEVCVKHCYQGCSIEPSPRAFLTMPSACSGDLNLGAMSTGWLGSTTSGEADFSAADGEVEAVQGCERLDFEPSLTIGAQSQAPDSPTGLSVDLKVPQNEGPYGLASATLKRVSVQLPSGMAVDPSVADGLGACSPAQIGIGTNLPAGCPDASKIGTAELTTPVLETPIKGSIYLAEQTNNPFGTLLAAYLVVEGEGVVVKLPGRVDADSATGELTATFDNNPQLPFSELKVQFNSGARAPLVTPPRCGTYTTRSELTSWASTTPVVVEAPMTFDEGCSSGGFSPQLQAGTVSPVAGTYSPFTLRVTRSDGEQNISRISATLPEGLLAKLAAVPMCGDAEAITGACPAATEVGKTTVGVGAGTQPLYIPQPGAPPTGVYLAGPYEGAPFSLVVDVPAQAGPFNLGNIAVRVALDIDPNTAQVTAVSDPLPQILQGIPISYRDLRIEINRPGFVLNPTSCEAMRVTTALSSATGTTATPSDRFQVAGCSHLGFKPTLTATTQAKTSRSHGASLVIKMGQKSGEANIHKVLLQIPSSLPTRLSTLQKACMQAQFNTNPAGCPEGSYIGTGTAHTPLLASPLTGPAILVSHGGAAFPDVEFLLSGENVHLTLDGTTNITKGITYSYFETVPDVPITSFETTLPEGPHSIFGANGNLCAQALTIPTTIVGQDGATLNQNTHIEASGCSRALSILSRAVSKRTLKLTVYAPGAGRVTASGPGVSLGTRSFAHHEAQTLTLTQKHGGRLKTKITIVFRSRTGKRQTKTITAVFKK